MKTRHLKACTFVELQYRFQKIREARNSRLMLGKPHARHNKALALIASEIVRRNQGMKRVAEWNRKYKRRTA